MADEGVPAVCVVTHPLASGGELATRDLLAILSALTSVALLTPLLPRESGLRDDFETVELDGWGIGPGVVKPAIGFALNQVRMAQAVARREEELVLFFGGTSYLLPVLVAKAIGKTVVLEPRGDVPLTLRLNWERRVPAAVARWLAGAVWLLERVGFWLADAIVTYTPAMARELGIDTSSEKLYPEGARFVDLDQFYPRTPFDQRGDVVGFLGRLDEEKGIRLLAAVARRLPEDVTFRFVGGGRLREWLEAELAEEVDAGRVELVDWVDHEDVPVELSRLRLLVMPSAPTEGLPTTILEAMACGTPAYATPVAGVPDVVRDGETGFHLDDVDPEVIRDDIVCVIRDPATERVSERARALVETEYSFESAVERYDAILRALA